MSSKTEQRIDHHTFDSFAFPVAKVRYAGPTDTLPGRFIATMRRDNERTYRATRSYHHEEQSGSAQAIHAATLVLAKALAENNPDAKPRDYIGIPGDLDADTYTFTFVPAYFFNGFES